MESRILFGGKEVWNSEKKYPVESDREREHKLTLYLAAYNAITALARIERHPEHVTELEAMGRNLRDIVLQPELN